MHDWYILWSRGEKVRPSTGDRGTNSDCLVRGKLHLRGSYNRYRIQVICLMELLGNVKEMRVHELLSCQNLKVL